MQVSLKADKHMKYMFRYDIRVVDWFNSDTFDSLRKKGMVLMVPSSNRKSSRQSRSPVLTLLKQKRSFPNIFYEEMKDRSILGRLLCFLSEQVLKRSVMKPPQYTAATKIHSSPQMSKFPLPFHPVSFVPTFSQVKSRDEWILIICILIRSFVAHLTTTSTYYYYYYYYYGVMLVGGMMIDKDAINQWVTVYWSLAVSLSSFSPHHPYPSLLGT